MVLIIKEIFDSIVKGTHTVTEAKVREALNQKVNPLTLLMEGMIPAMMEYYCQVVGPHRGDNNRVPPGAQCVY